MSVEFSNYKIKKVKFSLKTHDKLMTENIFLSKGENMSNKPISHGGLTVRFQRYEKWYFGKDSRRSPEQILRARRLWCRIARLRARVIHEVTSSVCQVLANQLTLPEELKGVEFIGITKSLNSLDFHHERIVKNISKCTFRRAKHQLESVETKSRLLLPKEHQDLMPIIHKYLNDMRKGLSRIQDTCSELKNEMNRIPHRPTPDSGLTIADILAHWKQSVKVLTHTELDGKLDLSLAIDAFNEKIAAIADSPDSRLRTYVDSITPFYHGDLSEAAKIRSAYSV